MRFNGGEGSTEYIYLCVNFGTSSKQKNSSKKYHAFLHKNVKYEIYSIHTHTHTEHASVPVLLVVWAPLQQVAEGVGEAGPRT